MENSTVGTKFSSINLNKSYGQQQYSHHNQYSSSRNSGSWGNRNRSSGMEVGKVPLAHPRSSHKISGSKLSIPPPLNLPSMKSEHERFDSLDSRGGSCADGSGIGHHPGSSVMGWTKYSVAVVNENDKIGYGTCGVLVNSANNSGVDQCLHATEMQNERHMYVMPIGRPVNDSWARTEKDAILRGEDFPSLLATHPSTEKNHKDGLNRKQKPIQSQKLDNEEQDGSNLSLVVDSSLNSKAETNANSFVGSECPDLVNAINSRMETNQDDEFDGPFPLAQLYPRSDWADDERDTGRALVDLWRDQGVPKNETHWEDDLGSSKFSVLAQKPGNSFSDRWVLHGKGFGNNSHGEVIHENSHGHVARQSVFEARSWRVTSPLQKGRYYTEDGGYRFDIGVQSSGMNKGTSKEKYISNSFHHNEVGGRRDVEHGNAREQTQNFAKGLFANQGTLWNNREHYSSEQYRRIKCDAFQNAPALIHNASSSFGGKGICGVDPLLHFNMEKCTSPCSEKTYADEAFMNNFKIIHYDSQKRVYGGFVSLVKKRKPIGGMDFHDPVRESFEAELERIQNIQELERQRVVKEQERAIECAQREEADRLQLVREQEELKQKLEEEAREAAWRVEQERVEAKRRALEQRRAVEEEKHKILMEEERRKQAAKQKLLELEERIAKRNAEAAKVDNIASVATDWKTTGEVFGYNLANVKCTDDCDSKKIAVNKIRIPDSSRMNKSCKKGSCLLPYRKDFSTAFDRGKRPWQRDVIDNDISSASDAQDQDNDFQSSRNDEVSEDKIFNSSEPYIGTGLLSSRAYREAYSESDHYARNLEVENDFCDNSAKRLDDVKCEPNHFPRYPFTLSSFHVIRHRNSRADVGSHSFERPYFSVRQSHVLAPPVTITSRSPCTVADEHPNSASFSEDKICGDHGSKVSTLNGSDNVLQINFGQQEIGHEQNTEVEAHKLIADTFKCDSPLSLSISNLPDSSVHFSHDDDIDDGQHSLALSAGDDKDVSLFGQYDESVGLMIRNGTENFTSYADNVFCGEGAQLQEQEEYDDDENGYGEDDELHDREGKKINISNKLRNMEVEDREFEGRIDNAVLGFNEGVEVEVPISFEKLSLNNEAMLMKSLSLEMVEEQVNFSKMIGDGDKPEGMEVSSEMNNNDSRVIQGTEKTKWDLSIQHKDVPHTVVGSGSFLVDHVNVSNTGLSSYPRILNSLGQPMHAVSSVCNQPKGSINLQFGMYSGCHLLSSAIPAIQIGSIQMPLHVKSLSEPSFLCEQASPPLFQLKCTSSSPQPIPFLDSNAAASFSFPFQPVQDMQSCFQWNSCTAHDIVENNGDSFSRRETKGIPDHQSHCLFMNNLKSSQTGESCGHLRNGSRSSQPLLREKDLVMLKGQRVQTSHVKGRRSDFLSRSSCSRPSFLHLGDSLKYHNGFQKRSHYRRTLFRVRESHTKKEITEFIPPVSEHVLCGNMPENGVGGACRNDHIFLCEGDDVDALMQRGISCFFEQSDVEASGDDDFIKVISKKQMLNHRREQGEKGMSESSRVLKVFQRSCPPSQGSKPPIISNKICAPGGGNLNKAPGFKNPAVSLPLPPIGTPAPKSGILGCLRSNTFTSEMSNGRKNAQNFLDSWNNSTTSQQVLALTQAQLDEAMKPSKLDSISSTVDHSNSVSVSDLNSSSMLINKNLLFPASSPLQSLLDGENIQFGAVLSPTVFSFGNHAVTHADAITQPEHNCKLGAHVGGSEVESSDPEFSFVAMSNSDDAVGNPTGASPTVVFGSRPFGSGKIDGASQEHQVASRSVVEETLSISLPADLCIEAPISLWSPPSKSQLSSSQMLSHVPVDPSSHIPFYEMGHILGGPFFTFGPGDVSASTQPISQKAGALVSGPPGPWQHQFSTDSFYGPPAFPCTPFINPSRSIQGIQGPPHMVVYNHFAPTGQFGQVGLSFLGSTHIPPVKQPDWKLDSTSAMDLSDVNMNNLNVVLSHNPATVPASIRHLAPGSPILHSASTFSVFDGLPLQPQAGVDPPHQIQVVPVCHMLTAETPVDLQCSTWSGNIRSLSTTAVTEVPEHGLGEQSNHKSSGTLSPIPVCVGDVGHGSCSAAASNPSKTRRTIQNSFPDNGNPKAILTFRKQPSGSRMPHLQDDNGFTGYNYQRRVPHKKNFWSKHGTGYHARTKNSGVEKGFPRPKMKQVYVVKQSAAMGTVAVST